MLSSGRKASFLFSLLFFSFLFFFFSFSIFRYCSFVLFLYIALVFLHLYIFFPIALFPFHPTSCRSPEVLREVLRCTISSYWFKSDGLKQVVRTFSRNHRAKQCKAKDWKVFIRTTWRFRCFNLLIFFAHRLKPLAAEKRVILIWVRQWKALKR